jgi:hypothetical protein
MNHVGGAQAAELYLAATIEVTQELPSDREIVGNSRQRQAALELQVLPVLFLEPASAREFVRRLRFGDDPFAYQ